MSSQKIKFGDKKVDKKNSIHLKKLFFRFYRFEPNNCFE